MSRGCWPISTSRVPSQQRVCPLNLSEGGQLRSSWFLVSQAISSLWTTPRVAYGTRQHRVRASKIPRHSRRAREYNWLYFILTRDASSRNGNHAGQNRCYELVIARIKKLTKKLSPLLQHIGDNTLRTAGVATSFTVALLCIYCHRQHRHRRQIQPTRVRIIIQLLPVTILIRTDVFCGLFTC